MKELVSGVKVSLGVVRAVARVIKDTSDLEKMKAGDILVLPKSDPVYALYVMRASGVICQNGGKLSHLCIVSLEMGIPCITSVKGACELIKDGDNIILDANEGKVYSCDE
jgi:pyruvate,water dikinase